MKLTVVGLRIIHLFILLSVFEMRKCSIILSPSDTTTSIGESNIRLRCSTDLPYPMVWQYYPVGSSKSKEISYDAVINKALISRYRVDKSNPGRYDLVIPRVDLEHAGKYTCHDNEGNDLMGAPAELIVLLSLEVNCSSNATDNVCAVEFCGNLEPVWTDERLCYDKLSGTEACPMLKNFEVPSSKLQFQDGKLLNENCNRNKPSNCICIVLYSNEKSTKNEFNDGDKQSHTSTALIASVSVIVIVIVITITAAAGSCYCRYKRRKDDSEDSGKHAVSTEMKPLKT